MSAAAYRSGEKLIDETDWQTKNAKSHDYTRRSGVVATGIVLPADAPKDFNNRATLWNAAERAERKSNSLVAREAILALPHELNEQQRLEATTAFAAYMVNRYGVGCDYAVHKPDRRGDRRNHHAHVMFTTRNITKDGLGDKTRVLDVMKTGSLEFKQIRKAWEEICNEALAKADINASVDCRSLKDQGIERLPEPKQGAIATQMEREGKTSHAGEDRRAFKEYNEALEQIPDEDTEEDVDEPDDDTAPPVRRKREVSKTQAVIKEARKHDRNIARLVHRRMLEMLRRLQQQRRRRQEQLRRRMQLLTRSMLMNTWRKNAGDNNANHNSQQQAQSPPTTAGLENYSEAEILAALAANGFELD